MDKCWSCGKEKRKYVPWDSQYLNYCSEECYQRGMQSESSPIQESTQDDAPLDLYPTYRIDNRKRVKDAVIVILISAGAGFILGFCRYLMWVIDPTRDLRDPRAFVWSMGLTEGFVVGLFFSLLGLIAALLRWRTPHLFSVPDD